MVFKKMTHSFMRLLNTLMGCLLGPRPRTCLCGARVRKPSFPGRLVPSGDPGSRTDRRSRTGRSGVKYTLACSSVETNDDGSGRPLRVRLWECPHAGTCLRRACAPACVPVIVDTCDVHSARVPARVHPRRTHGQVRGCELCGVKSLMYF